MKIRLFKLKKKLSQAVEKHPMWHRWQQINIIMEVHIYFYFWNWHREIFSHFLSCERPPEPGILFAGPSGTENEGLLVQISRARASIPVQALLSLESCVRAQVTWSWSQPACWVGVNQSRCALILHFLLSKTN